MKSDYGIYADLMQNFPLVTSVFLQLPKETQEVGTMPFYLCHR
jgi:hypothetical protein